MASREALQGPPSAFYDVDDGGTVQMSKVYIYFFSFHFVCLDAG
jgi:hypothetical protein